MEESEEERDLEKTSETKATKQEQEGFSFFHTAHWEAE